MPPDLAIRSEIVRFEPIVFKFGQGNARDIAFKQPFQYRIVPVQSIPDLHLYRTGEPLPLVVIVIFAFGAAEFLVHPSIADIVAAFQAFRLVLFVYSIFHNDAVCQLRKYPYMTPYFQQQY